MYFIMCPCILNVRSIKDLDGGNRCQSFEMFVKGFFHDYLQFKISISSIFFKLYKVFSVGWILALGIIRVRLSKI